jgi:hypothetical protein
MPNDEIALVVDWPSVSGMVAKRHMASLTYLRWTLLATRSLAGNRPVVDFVISANHLLASAGAAMSWTPVAWSDVTRMKASSAASP